MFIRKTTLSDLPRLMEIYAYARRFMEEHGNPRQWGATNWPPEELLREDIALGRSFVCVDGQDPADRIVGTFVYVCGPHAEPLYDEITDGDWPSRKVLGKERAETYGVIHRIAGDGSRPGIGSFCINWGFRQCGHLRMDTHGDNLVMQKLLLKLGFTRCGIVHVQEDPDPRFAFEKF